MNKKGIIGITAGAVLAVAAVGGFFAIGPIGLVLLIPAFGVMMAGLVMGSNSMFGKTGKGNNKVNKGRQGQVRHPGKSIGGIYFDKNKGIPVSTVKNTGMVLPFDEYKSFNLYSGSLEETDFYLGEVCLFEKSEGKEKLYFYGQWLTFRLGQSFPANIQVFTKHMGCAKPKMGYGTIECTDSTYRAFTNYSKQERKLLTPQLISILGRVSNNHSLPVMFIMLNGIVHVVVETGRNTEEGYEIPAVAADRERFIPQKNIEELRDTIRGFKEIFAKVYGEIQ